MQDTTLVSLSLIKLVEASSKAMEKPLVSIAFVEAAAAKNSSLCRGLASLTDARRGFLPLESLIPFHLPKCSTLLTVFLPFEADLLPDILRPCPSDFQTHKARGSHEKWAQRLLPADWLA